MKKTNMKFTTLFSMCVLAHVTHLAGQDFVADQYSQSAIIVLHGNIERVFPLFTALGEKKWAEGWNPTLIFPTSGVMDEGLIFQTPDHVHGTPPLTWVVGKFDKSRHQITYIITSAIRVGVISVTCMGSSNGNTTAEIKYALTGLSAEGNQISQHLIAKLFINQLKDWETAINNCLKTSN
jgi:hypothetical protein